MEYVKNISSVLSLILSSAAILTLFSTKAKTFIASIFSKYNEKQDNDIAELKKGLIELTNTLNTFVEETNDKVKILSANSEISLEFTKQQCRNIIKSIFYKYYDEKILPLYEYKTLKAVEDIYVNRCHGNSYAQEMLDIMSHWEVDYTKSRLDED